MAEHTDMEITRALLGSELPDPLFDGAAVVQTSDSDGLITLEDGTSIDIRVRIRPSVIEKDEGLFWLTWSGEEQGPYPSRDAAWADYRKELES